MGMTPMEYLLAWRIGLSKHFLILSACGLAEAERDGYSSVNRFRVAYIRYAGVAQGAMLCGA
ncbi:transcriptional regulator [Methylobacillus flagellatus KT]|uniref:Transcriptional regulator n=1 Tax=Methylobacillus flagellatus (strain ATCC 51484 / DSM 6875 / VKM B-1610 / KT) TaxID=265072 RepID=Q1H0I9_METFK|nr:transcriptional regulator [Methylobacillus flagellatus KT]